MVCRWTRKGIRVYAWTVNSPLEKLHLTQNLRIGHLTDTLDGGDLRSASGSGTDVAISQLKENGSKTVITKSQSAVIATAGSSPSSQTELSTSNNS